MAETKTEKNLHLVKVAPKHTSHKAPTRVISASTVDGLGEYNNSGMGGIQSIGKPLVPVVMVEFTDKSFLSTTTKEKMTRYYNEKGYSDETHS